MQQQSVMRRPPGVARGFDFGDLVELLPSLRAFALGLCRNGQAADELVHETILQGVLSIGERDPDVPIRAWLFTIMRNAFHTGVRLSNERTAVWTGGQEARRAMRRRATARAICGLPPEQREAVVLVSVLGMSSRDAAVACGSPVVAMERRLDRARQALAAQVGPCAIDELRPG